MPSRSCRCGSGITSADKIATGVPFCTQLHSFLTHSKSQSISYSTEVCFFSSSMFSHLHLFTLYMIGVYVKSNIYASGPSCKYLVKSPAQTLVQMSDPDQKQKEITLFCQHKKGWTILFLYSVKLA